MWHSISFKIWQSVYEALSESFLLDAHAGIKTGICLQSVYVPYRVKQICHLL